MVVDVDITAEQIASGLGSIMAVLLFSAPAKDIFGKDGVVWNKNTNNLATAFPYFAAVFNCIAWILYCFPVFNDYVLPTLINMFGALVNICYISCYWMYTTPEQSRNCFVYSATGFSIILLAAVVEYTLGRLATGYIAALINIVLCYSPLAAASEVIRTKSVAKYPFLPLLFTFMCGCCWTAYGVIKSDVPIIIREFSYLFCLSLSDNNEGNNSQCVWRYIWSDPA